MLTFTSEDGNQDPTQKTVENGGDIKAVGDGIDCIGGRGISRAWEDADADAGVDADADSAQYYEPRYGPKRSRKD